MVISYNKLWKLLIDNNMKKMDLIDKIGIGTTTLAKLSKNQIVSMTVLVKLCELFHCNVGDIMDILPAVNTIAQDEK